MANEAIDAMERFSSGAAEPIEPIPALKACRTQRERGKCPGKSHDDSGKIQCSCFCPVFKCIRQEMFDNLEAARRA